MVRIDNIRGWLACLLIVLSPQAWAQGENFDFQQYVETSVENVDAAERHFEFAENLREISILSFSQVGSMTPVFLAAYEANEAGTAEAQLAYREAKATYAADVARMMTNFNSGIANATSSLERLPDTLQVDAKALIESARSVFSESKDRVDTLALELDMVARGEDSDILGETVTKMLQALVRPALTGAARFAAESYAFEQKSIRPFLTGETQSAQLGISPDYLEQLHYVTENIVDLPSSLMQVSCLEGENDVLDAAPLNTQLSALDGAFTSPDDIDSASYDMAFAILMDADNSPPETAANLASTRHVIEELIQFEMGGLAIIDTMRGIIEAGALKNCANAVAKREEMTSLVSRLIIHLVLDPARAEYRANIYAEARHLYQSLAAGR